MHDDTYPGIQTLLTPRVNGGAEPGDTRGKRIANRTPWLDLPEPYDNLKVRVWLDYPQEIAELLTAPGPKPDGSPGETPEEASERIMEFLKGVILQHDGWDMGDDEGALQSPDTDDFWRRIPTALGRVISERFFEELQVGNSRGSRKMKRRNLRRR